MNFYKAGSGVGPVTGYPVKPLPVKSIRMFWNEIMKYFTMILLFLCMLFLCSSCTISHVQIPNLKCDEAWKICDQADELKLKISSINNNFDRLMLEAKYEALKAKCGIEKSKCLK